MVCAGSPALLCSRGVFQLKPRSLIRKMLPCFWKPGALTTAWPWLRRCSGVDNKSALMRHRAAQPCRLGDPALRTHEKSEYLKRNCVTARWGGKHREVSPIDRITSERDPASKVDEPASERLSHQRVRGQALGKERNGPRHGGAFDALGVVGGIRLGKGSASEDGRPAGKESRETPAGVNRSAAEIPSEDTQTNDGKAAKVSSSKPELKSGRKDLHSGTKADRWSEGRQGSGLRKTWRRDSWVSQVEADVRAGGKLLTAEPDAGNPPVRFGGRMGRKPRRHPCHLSHSAVPPPPAILLANSLFKPEKHFNQHKSQGKSAVE